MKKVTNLTRSIVCSAVIVLSGCMAEPQIENSIIGDSTSSTRSPHDGKYYYAFDEKVPLYETSSRMVVTFDKEHRSSVEMYMKQDTRIAKEKLEICEGYTIDFAVISVDSKSGEITMLRDELLKQTGIKSVRRIYALDDGYEMGYTNEIVMQFKDGASSQEIDAMRKKFGAEVIKTSESYVLLSVPMEFDPLYVANAYQESGLTNYSHPNFLVSAVNYQSLPTDPYFNNQFYLRNVGQGVNGLSSTAGADINAVNAWTITKGSSDIIIAIIDYDGFTSNHPDIWALNTDVQIRQGGITGKITVYR